MKQSLWNNSSAKYEVWLKGDSKCEVVDENLEVVPEIKTVTPLSSLTEEQKEPVDVVGVVRRVSEPTTIRNSSMRELEIADDSDRACLLTLWGTWSEGEFHCGDIVSVTKAKVSAFKGISLGTTALSTVAVNPGSNDAVTRLSDWIEESQVDVQLFPLVGKEKRRRVEKLSGITKSGIALVVVKKIFLDRKMTFVSKKTGNTEMVLKIAVEDESGRHIVSGEASYFVLFCFVFFGFVLSDPILYLSFQCSTRMRRRFFAKMLNRSRFGRTRPTFRSWRLQPPPSRESGFRSSSGKGKEAGQLRTLLQLKSNSSFPPSFCVFSSLVLNYRVKKE